MTRRALIVASDAKLREALAIMLAPAGYTVELAESARRVIEISTASRVDLAILAPAAFDGAFQDVAREMAHSVGRLIVVADQPEVADRFAGLGIKVDVCIAKPFAAGEVLTRVGTILELGNGGHASIVNERELWMFDGFTLDVEGHSLTDARGQEVALSRSEFALVTTLASRQGRVLSRSQLLGATTRHPDDVYDRSVDVMIWRLRRKIELDPKQPRLIITVPGVGYKFAASVRKGRAAVDKGTTPEQPLPLQPVERRHVTVLAYAFVGLDALSSERDPDEINAVVGLYRRACSQAVGQFAASAGRFSGEGGQFYFGYPEAHEHAAERAVRAGLRIVDAVAALARDTAVALRTRIGIASGLVVVGNLHGSDGTDIVGEPASLAAQLRSLAAPDAVLIADDTRDLVRGLFKYKKIDPINLWDTEEPIAAWQVVGESVVESRFDALRASGLVPMVGREGEMELLWRRWRQSAKGDGRTVLISGEPGIGKSRLAKSLIKQIESEPHTRLFYQCSPYHKDSALYPVIAQIERTAGFEKGDQPEQRLGKLDELLSSTDVDRAAAVPLLAALLSIPTSGRYQPRVLSPAQRRGQTLSALIGLVAGIARRRPMLLIFEDAHWADATSLEWLDLAIDLARRMWILIIVTHRLEFKPPWSGRPNISAVMLGRLMPIDVRAMIREISIGCQLPARVIDRIVAQTDGIPLYVEELTKMIVGSASAPRSGPAEESPAFVIPHTLQDSLMGRIDSLGSAREVAQIGATIGRDFSYPLLLQLTALDESALGRELKALEKSELIFGHGPPPESTYSFTHIMVQEAIRETLPTSRRRALHRRIAELLCDPIKGPDTTEPEVVARHFTEAGMNEAGAQWWGKAAEKALSRAAYAEAIANFGKAIGLAQEMAAGQDHRLLLRLQIGYGQALIAARGHGAPETTAAFARARELADGIENRCERLSALYGLWSGSFCRAELAPMRELADRFAKEVEIAPKLCKARILADRLLGATAWFCGQYRHARRLLDSVVANYDSELHAPLARRFGQDVGVCAMVNLAFVLWTMGETRAAWRQMEAARNLALEGGHIPTIAYMRVHEALACISVDPQAVLLPARSAVEIGHRHGLPLWLVSGTFCIGWSLWHAGDREVGLTQMREAMEHCREHGAIFLPICAFLRAEAEALSGDVETALALVVDQIADIERSGQRWLEAELHRRHAELLIQREPRDETAAEAAFVRALGIARAQHARLFELRAAIGLAQLYQSQSRVDAAREVLAAISGAHWDPDLREVQAARRILCSSTVTAVGPVKNCKGSMRR